MSGLKTIFIGIALLLILCGAFAYSPSLSSLGFGGISSEKAYTKECKEVVLPAVEGVQGAGILSLRAEFVDYVEDSSYVALSIGKGEEKILWPENFACEQYCYARIFIPEFGKEEISLKICTYLGALTKKIEVSADSFAGDYNTSVLSIKNEAPEWIFLGSRAKMSIIVSNSGTKSEEIFVQFVHPDTRAKVAITSFDIVDGDSSANTTIFPGETKHFDYYIKPSVVSSYNLPSAALFFTNHFGEEEVLISNHPQMSVVNPNPIDVSIISISEKNPYAFNLIIKNNQEVDFNGTVIISPQTAFSEFSKELFVKAKSEETISFETNELSSGHYSFFATLKDQNNIFSSNIIGVEANSGGLPFEIILAILAVIFGGAIFAWIYLMKENN